MGTKISFQFELRLKTVREMGNVKIFRRNVCQQECIYNGLLSGETIYEAYKPTYYYISHLDIGH